jgi:phosphoribosylglycinamide formyltransferase 1
MTNDYFFIFVLKLMSIVIKRIAIFASGTGTNAQNIIQYFEHNASISVGLIVSNKSQAPVLTIAKEHQIPIQVINRDNFYHTEDILKKLNEYSIDFVVLAGFLWLIPGYFVKAFENRIVNIHPALLPKYGGKGMFGMKVHRAVLQAAEKETGITIHYVNAKYDEGAIIFQTTCPILPEDTPETIAKKVHQLEYAHFPRVIEEVIQKISTTHSSF